MAVNISDMAAMGAMPKWVTLNLTLSEINESWLKAFAEGFSACAQQSNVLLIGGDLTSGTEINISAQILGEVSVNKALLRSQAKVNDLIYVTGRIGLAGSALSSLKIHHDDHSQLSASQMKALYQPEPRIALGCELGRFAHAAIDVSDGLLHDLELICQASGVGAELHIDLIPVTEEINILDAITAGDDYELIFTVAEKYQAGIDLLSQQYACQITQIGKITAGSGHVDLLQQGQKISRPDTTGFDHFTQTR
jgi:thiamine-monophosphate kinase